MKRTEESLRDLWNNTKSTNIHLKGVPKWEEKGPEKIREEIVAKIFPNMWERKHHPNAKAQAPPESGINSVCDMCKFLRNKTIFCLDSYFYTIFYYSVSEKRKEGGKRGKFLLREDALIIYVNVPLRNVILKGLWNLVQEEEEIPFFTLIHLLIHTFPTSRSLQCFPSMIWPANWVEKDIK